MQWKLQQKDDCVGENQYREHPPECRHNSVYDTQMLSENNETICSHNQRVRFVEWYRETDVKTYLGFEKDKLRLAANKTALVIFVPGLHSNLYNPDILLTDYVTPLIMEARALHNHNVILLIGLHAMLPNMPAEYAAKQSAKAILYFNNALRVYAEQHQLAYLDFFSLSAGHPSVDGVHVGMHVNLLKAQLILNYLDLSQQ
jgi:hypothetical protein